MFKDVFVVFGSLNCGIGARDFEKIAKFGEEQDVVGTFRSPGVLPTRDEVGRHGMGCGLVRRNPQFTLKG